RTCMCQRTRRSQRMRLQTVPAKNLMSERFFDFRLRTTRQERHLECELGVSRLNVSGSFDATIDYSPTDGRTSMTPLGSNSGSTPDKLGSAPFVAMVETTDFINRDDLSDRLYRP